MSRKIITAFLSLVCAITCAFALVACGGGGGDVQATGISLNRETEEVDGILTGDTLNFAVGQSATLTATLEPANAISPIEWSSNNPEIASVDGNGKVTANNVGNAIITATANGQSAFCYVRVKTLSVSDFSAEAAAFARANVRTEALGGKDVKSELWSMQLNDDNTVDKFSVLYVCAMGVNERVVELADITLTTPLSFYDIIDNAVSEVQCSVDYKAVFSFDAKYNRDNQEITDALYDCLHGNNTTDMKIILEVEPTYKSHVAYNYILVEDGKIDIYMIEVEPGDGSIKNIVWYINQGEMWRSAKISSYSMTGTTIYTEDYANE